MLFVYFIQAGDGGPIKIGLADDPDARCAFLQVGNHEDLVLLAVRPGSMTDERELHSRFAAGRLRGEWFRADTPGLRAEIHRAVQIEAELALDDTRGLCCHCGTRPVTPPRTRVCSAECERERKRARSARWRVERASGVPSEAGRSSQ